MSVCAHGRQGWLFVGALVAVLAYYGAKSYSAHRKAEAYRHAALKELIEAGDDPVRIAEIVRRAALSGFPREEVAGLAGDDWLAFLNRTYSGDDFSGETGRAFLAAPFRKSERSPALAELARQWVRNHKRPEKSA